MGKLLYGSPSMEVDFDDRALMHLQIVITAKLRRGESFVFTWRDTLEVGDGRSSFWMHSSIPLYFRYFGSRVPVINRLWIEALSASSNSPGGLHFSEEPPPVPR
ncbi:MAG: ATP-dependent DNA ligase [Burkholderiaceae bacterium]|nr:ATP-dependent DNA ligase [Microbacteriaceae bacterium]